MSIPTSFPGFRSSFGVAALVACLAGPAWAFNPQPDPPGTWRLGAVTLLSGQGIRVNVSNLRTPQPAGTAAATTPEDHCFVQVSLLDGGAGELLPAVQKSLPAGQTLSFEWTFNLANATGAVVRPVVSTFCDGSVKPPSRRSGPYAPSVEIFDVDTGKTSFTLGAGELLPAVQRLR
jgi:hypothetical protein